LIRAILIGLAAGGCSLIVNSSINGLLCNTDPTKLPCEEGYSCDGGQCIADGSVGDGHTCTLTKQCATGLVCPVGNVCRKPCEKIYQFGTNECSADQVCAPLFDSDGVHFSGGACVPTECQTGSGGDTTCQTSADIKYAPPGSADNPQTGNKCVRLATNGGLCLQSCVVGKRAQNVGGGGPDLDSCTTDTRGNATHCGIIDNSGGAPDYACLPAGQALVGEPCALFPLSGTSVDACAINYPAEPLVCMADDGSLAGTLRCQQVCTASTASADCSGSQACTALDGDTTQFSYCTTVSR
jgi:hypothetical protein